jgi:adapter protein MecA 1/2
LHVAEEPPIPVDNFIALLAEFGSPSTITIHRVQEYGKKLIERRAIEQLVHYFPAD